jgi:hypothetical protein
VSEQVRARRSIAAIALIACAAAPTAARAASSASIQPSFQPYTLGASAAGTISVRFSGGIEHVPAPLSAMTLRLPAGLRINLGGVGICQASRLRSRGAGGCSRASLLGRGHALMVVHAGSQTLPEEATISVFRGPNRGSDPGFEVFGQGLTPLDESTVSTGVLEPDSAPYGSKLLVSVPPIPTLTYEPNASFSSLSLTIGNAGGAARVELPRSCPPGGFPFAASFSFADLSTAGAVARLPCP